ncbi:apolipo A-I [Pelobates cultripes]|uniref:Apolipo A-I n=1 Tax=Pelobates cultripes TaxID=61616 RepID=A0AAD1TBR3_PELCU|nr:apolipo A-I [Pelobates cultripes]
MQVINTHDVEDVDKTLDEKYPVFKKNILPQLIDFRKRWDEYALNMRKDIFIHTLNLFNGLKNQVEKFYENVAPVLEKGCGKLRFEVKELHAKIVPYLEGLKNELEKNRKEMHGELAKRYVTLVEKEMDALRESIKPHFKDLKQEVVPHARDLQEYYHLFCLYVNKIIFTCLEFVGLYVVIF